MYTQFYAFSRTYKTVYNKDGILVLENRKKIPFSVVNAKWNTYKINLAV